MSQPNVLDKVSARIKGHDFGDAAKSKIMEGMVSSGRLKAAGFNLDSDSEIDGQGTLFLILDYVELDELTMLVSVFDMAETMVLGERNGKGIEVSGWVDRADWIEEASSMAALGREAFNA